jgi:hypothetical protein
MILDIESYQQALAVIDASAVKMPVGLHDTVRAFS